MFSSVAAQHVERVKFKPRYHTFFRTDCGFCLRIPPNALKQSHRAGWSGSGNRETKMEIFGWLLKKLKSIKVKFHLSLKIDIKF